MKLRRYSIANALRLSAPRSYALRPARPGNPKLPVTKVSAAWGYMSSVAMAARPEIEVLVVGETHEWEVVEYIQDCITAGQKKALIVIGHVLSEQAGMNFCAEWLKTLVPEVPVQFIAAAEPFWNPDNPTG